MKIAGQFCRMVLAFPLVFPLFLFVMLLFMLENFILWPRQDRHPLSDFIDRVWLHPWNNFIDYGSFRCS